MDKQNYDRDNISQSGRPIHTYTPRSHEDLIKSHLNLDAARKAKIQNELSSLAAENDQLRRTLQNAYTDLQNKDNDIRTLSNQLRDRNIYANTPAVRDTVPLYEIDGKQLSVDGIIDHFNVIIQRHHDLINRKNQQIQDLQDELANQPTLRSPQKRDAFMQSSREKDITQQLMADFSNQMVNVRKEYEQAENKLTERNYKLERSIEDLQRKLDDYQREIQLLRNDLAQRQKNAQPSESTQQLIRGKEKENAHLQELIANLQNDDDMKKLIEQKKDAINKINKMVDDIDQANDPGTSGLNELERDCKTMISDLNNMDDKLKNILKKLKESQTSPGGDPLDKRDLINNLENVKKQCQDEIAILENKIHPGLQKTLSDIPSRSGTEPTPSIRTVTIATQDSYHRSQYRARPYPLVPCEACSTPYLPNDYDRTTPQAVIKQEPPRREEIPPRQPTDTRLISEMYGPSTRARSQSPERQKKRKGGCCGKKGSNSSNIPYSKHVEDERLVQVYNPSREVSPGYKIGLGSRLMLK